MKGLSSSTGAPLSPALSRSFVGERQGLRGLRGDRGGEGGGANPTVVSVHTRLLRGN